MDASEDMQIMCFGDVYVPSTEAEKVEERPAFEERIGSGIHMNAVPSPPAPTRSPLARLTATPSSPNSQPPSPCQSYHQSQARAVKRKSSIRSFFLPTTFKGKLVQCLVSTAFLGSSLAAYLTFVFTKNITVELQTVFILLILAFGIFALHSVISLFLVRIQQRRAPTLPITTRCENEKDCEYCNQTRDALPRDDSLYAPDAAIRVHLGRDEELKNKRLHTPHVSSYTTNNASQLSLAVPSPPPAYGAWRCSVLADPNLLHWHKVDDTTAAGDLAAMTEPEFMEEIPLSPTVAAAWKEQDTAMSQNAVRVSIGRVKPAMVNIRASGSWSGRGSVSSS